MQGCSDFSGAEPVWENYHFYAGIRCRNSEHNKIKCKNNRI